MEVIIIIVAIIYFISTLAGTTDQRNPKRIHTKKKYSNNRDLKLNDNREIRHEVNPRSLYTVDEKREHSELLNRYPKWYGSKNIIGQCFKAKKIAPLVKNETEIVNYKTDRYTELFGRGNDCSYFPGYGKICNREFNIWYQNYNSTEMQLVQDYFDIGVEYLPPFFSEEISDGHCIHNNLERTRGYLKLYNVRVDKTNRTWYAGLKHLEFTGIITDGEVEFGQSMPKIEEQSILNISKTSLINEVTNDLYSEKGNSLKPSLKDNKVKPHDQPWYPNNGINKQRIIPKSNTKILWEEELKKITNDYRNNPKHFIDSIVSLGNSNRIVSSKDNIFLEASKFISRHNKEAALTLYVYYLYNCLKSSAFSINEQANFALQNDILASKDQLKEFQIIENQLIKDKNLEKALQGIPNIFIPKKKKINLSKDAIADAHQKHSGTVELLNNYLQDESEDSLSKVKTEEINGEEVQIEIQKKEPAASKFADAQRELLDTFQKNGLTLSDEEIELFAKSRGLFKNQLIESLNDSCYDTLDDLLIEEDGEYYSINPDYLQRILTL